MSGWAEEAAKRAVEKSKAEGERFQRAKYEAQLKDKAGPELFARLERWVGEQVTTYNKQQTIEELVVARAEKEASISVFRAIDRDWKREMIKIPLTFTYNPDTYTLRCKCYGGAADYQLSVSSSDEVRFWVSPEAIAEQWLKDFEASPLVRRERPVPRIDTIPRHI